MLGFLEEKELRRCLHLSDGCGASNLDEKRTQKSHELFGLFNFTKLGVYPYYRTQVQVSLHSSYPQEALFSLWQLSLLWFLPISRPGTGRCRLLVRDDGLNSLAGQVLAHVVDDAVERLAAGQHVG